jgi:formate dehydrogenase major subunit
VASLAPTFGRGAMTNVWMDIKNADVIVIMGGNAAEAHPCGFKWVTEAKAHNKARLIVVDPRFTRSASVADLYVPIRQGADIAWLNGLVNYLLQNDRIHKDYVVNYTNAAYILKEGFAFEEGLFSGFDAAKKDYDRSSWDYELDEQGFAKVDPTLQDPRCVYQVMKRFYARYTPEMVSKITGSPLDKMQKAWEWMASTAVPDRAMTSMYALGWTQHSKGSQNIRAMAIVQLLLGNIGIQGGGMNALRGHSNIQGLTDLGLMSNLLPGYLTLAGEDEPDLATYMKSRGFKPLRPGQTSYWQNYRKFFVSFQKSMWGKAATAENDFAYDWLPKLDVASYDVLRAFELMHKGKVNGYFCQGFNPLMAFPNRKKLLQALSNLKFLVVMDPLDTETARIWEAHPGIDDVDSSAIQTEVFQLPTTCFAEENGSLTNSSRWVQWHWKGADPPGEAETDIWIMAQLWRRLKALYEKEGGAFPDPILNLHWPYLDAANPQSEEVAREINGYVVEDVADPQDAGRILLRAGQQLDTFAAARDDGKTAIGCWVYTGIYTEAGNIMARRDTSDPRDAGLAPNWSFAWPANRRILYNRASADAAGTPFNPKRALIEWSGSRWTGIDVPDYGPTVKPEAGVGPFIMNPEGVARLFTRGMMRDGPLPEHYEPVESPVDNLMHPKVGYTPVVRIFDGDKADFATAKEFPLAAVTYRLTEHFHWWTKNVHINAVLQPEQIVEISEALAAEKGIAKGDVVRIWSKRGDMLAKAVVTKRVRPLDCGGKTVHIVGIPLHYGFVGMTRKSRGVNALSPFVGDANIETPEYKAFLVNIEKAKPMTS